MVVAEDVRRFKDKLKLKGGKYFSNDTIKTIGSGGKTIQVPFPRIDLPRFKFDEDTLNSGLDGEEGDAGRGYGVGQGDEFRPGPGHGTETADHNYEELSFEEAGDILAEELQLPNLLEKFSGNLGVQTSRKYTGISRVGTNPLRDMKRSFKAGLRRTIGEGEYDPAHPKIILQPGDIRYKSPKETNKPLTKAALVFVKDCSGSTGSVLDYLQLVGFWAEAWIRKHYQNVDIRYIDYDAMAEERSRTEFYTVKPGGGTSMKAGLLYAKRMIRQEYSESEYNVFLFQFTDGDAGGMNITQEDIETYKAWIGQIQKDYGVSIPFDEDEMSLDNPLTNFLISRCSAIFVAEAASFDYGDNQYSRLLEKMVEDSPRLQGRIRYVSQPQDEIEAARGAKVKELLLHWFKD